MNCDVEDKLKALAAVADRSDPQRRALPGSCQPDNRPHQSEDGAGTGLTFKLNECFRGGHEACRRL